MSSLNVEMIQCMSFTKTSTRQCLYVKKSKRLADALYTSTLNFCSKILAEYG